MLAEGGGVAETSRRASVFRTVLNALNAPSPAQLRRLIRTTQPRAGAMGGHGLIWKLPPCWVTGRNADFSRQQHPWSEGAAHLRAHSWVVRCCRLKPAFLTVLPA